MANTKSLPPGSSVDYGKLPIIEPLTRKACIRSPETERQIADAITLAPAALVKRAQQRQKSASEFLSDETLVYFIRRTIRKDDAETRDDLFRELFERCIPYFRGKFRGFDQQRREDLQSEVMTK